MQARLVFPQVFFCATQQTPPDTGALPAVVLSTVELGKYALVGCLDLDIFRPGISQLIPGSAYIQEKISSWSTHLPSTLKNKRALTELI